jgi:hypothetical protein
VIHGEALPRKLKCGKKCFWFNIFHFIEYQTKKKFVKINYLLISTHIEGASDVQLHQISVLFKGLQREADVHAHHVSYKI